MVCLIICLYKKFIYLDKHKRYVGSGSMVEYDKYKMTKRGEQAIKAYIESIAEHTRNESQLNYLLETGDSDVRLVTMFNQLITGNVINNKLDKLERDKNPFVSFDAKYIKIEQMLAIKAVNVDDVADQKEIVEKTREKNVKKLLRPQLWQ